MLDADNVKQKSYYPTTIKTTNNMKKRARIVSAKVNGTFKPIETKTTTSGLWEESIVCVPVTHQTVEGAEKSRRYRKPTDEQIKREAERKEKIARRKAFEAMWEQRNYEEKFRGCNVGQTFIH